MNGKRHTFPRPTAQPAATTLPAGDTTTIGAVTAAATQDQGGLSGGAIAGICAAVVFVAAVVIALAVKGKKR